MLQSSQGRSRAAREPHARRVMETTTNLLSCCFPSLVLLLFGPADQRRQEERTQGWSARPGGNSRIRAGSAARGHNRTREGQEKDDDALLSCCCPPLASCPPLVPLVTRPSLLLLLLSSCPPLVLLLFCCPSLSFYSPRFAA